MEREEYTMDKIRVDELEDVAGGTENTYPEGWIDELETKPLPDGPISLDIEGAITNPHAKIKKGPGLG